MVGSARAGRLFLVATPIGNPEDITLRALEVLRRVPVVACEDTRTTRNRLASLGIPPPRLVSLFEHNEPARVAELVRGLADGTDVALVSEAGTPAVSDPGYRLVAACVEQGIPVVPVPGPCAAIAALAASGLPTDRFLFLGFPPKKGGKLAAFLSEVVHPGRTAIVYLPPRRLPEFLRDLAAAAPLARVAVARELTKLHEEFLRGSPQELLDSLTDEKLLGECTVVVYVPPTVE